MQGAELKSRNSEILFLAFPTFGGLSYKTPRLPLEVCMGEGGALTYCAVSIQGADKDFAKDVGRRRKCMNSQL